MQYSVARYTANIHGRRNILVQLGGSGELLSEQIDKALRISEGYEGFGSSWRFRIGFEVQNRSDPPSSGGATGQ